MKFRYLDHTADVKFQAFGKTLEEAFANSVMAAFSVLYDTSRVKPSLKKEIRVSARRPESLLYDFLEEFLFLLDTEGFFPGKIEKIMISQDEKGYSLECTASGDSYRNYEIVGHIKSVTYNEMFIKKEDSGYVIQAVMDI